MRIRPWFGWLVAFAVLSACSTPLVAEPDGAADAGCASEHIRFDFTANGVRYQACEAVPQGIRVDVDFADRPIAVSAMAVGASTNVLVGASTSTLDPLPFVTAGTFPVTVNINVPAAACGVDANGCTLWATCNLVVPDAAAFGTVGEGAVVGPCTIIESVSGGPGELNELSIRGTLVRVVRNDHLDAGRD